MLENMAPPWKTFQRLIDVTENLVFNEAPKFIRTIQKSETLQRGIQTGILLADREGIGSACRFLGSTPESADQ